MMKTKQLLLSAGAVFSSMNIYAQVGINNMAPKATMEINAKNETGTSSIVEGLIIPRVDRQRVQSMSNVPESTLVYVNSIATGTAAGTTVNIIQPGYYYFNGSQWQRFNDEGVAPLTKVAFNGSGALDATVIPGATVTKITFPSVNITVDPEIGIWNSTTNELTVNKKGVFTISASLSYENLSNTTNAVLIIRAGNESDSTITNVLNLAGAGAAGPFSQRNSLSTCTVLDVGDKIWIEASRQNMDWAMGRRALNITFSEVN